MVNKKSKPRQKVKKQVSKKVTIKKVHPKRVPYKRPVSPSVYDLCPMRELVELLVYNCYTRSDAFTNNPIQDEMPKPVKVSRTALKKRINGKAAWFEVKQFISENILEYYHVDQKLLLWDYLGNNSLPKSIDLKYNYIPRSVIGICHTIQQRQIIEVYTSLGYPPKKIAEVIARVREIMPLTEQEVEIYQYFFWNLEYKGHTAYPLQKLGQKIVSLDLRLRDVNKDGYNIQHGINPPKKLPVKIVKLLDGSTWEDTQKYVYAPYLRTTRKENYILWEEACSDEVVRPCDSYMHIIRVGMGNVRANAIFLDFGVPDVSKVGIGQKLTNIIKREVTAVNEDSINQNILAAAARARGVLLPVATAAVMLKIPIEVGDDDLGTRTKVLSISQEELGQPKEIDIHKPLPGLEDV